MTDHYKKKERKVFIFARKKGTLELQQNKFKKQREKIKLNLKYFKTKNYNMQ